MLVEDELRDVANVVAAKSKTLVGAPITFNFAEKNISAIVSNDEIKIYNLIKNIIIQLITFHNYEDLNLVFLLEEDKKKNWEYVKTIPHIWNSSKEIRFFADNYDDMEKFLYI